MQIGLPFGPTLKCANCERDFELRTVGREQRTKFCTRKCMHRYFDRFERIASRVCAQCGSSYMGRADRKQCPSCHKEGVCSRRRNRTEIRLASLERKLCPECSSPVPHGPRRYCKSACAKVARNRALTGRPKPQRYVVRRCAICLVDFRTAKSTKLQCSRCIRAQMKRDRGKHHGESHRQRAIRLGVQHERVERMKVFEAANWRCQICDIETPRTLLRDHKHLSAPTLDHVIPLSLGGSHTYSNCQCLCRLCNGRKGNRIIDTTNLSHVVALMVGWKRMPSEMARIVSEFGATTTEGGVGKCS